MSQSFEEILSSRRMPDFLTRLHLRDGVSHQGVITVYNTNTGCVRLLDSDEARCLDLLVEDLNAVEILDYRPDNWSL